MMKYASNVDLFNEIYIYISTCRIGTNSNANIAGEKGMNHNDFGEPRVLLEEQV